MNGNFNKVKTTIVIPTYNGSRKVERLLVSLAAQLNETRELIIVDDGSIDGSASRIDRLIKSNKFSKLIQQSNGGRSAARNAGAREANGEFIVFIDDDIIVPQNFLNRIEQVQKRYPYSWVTGSVVQDIPDLPYQDFLKFRSRLDYIPKNQENSIDGLVEKSSFSTQQLSVRSTIFHEIGGFDERLTDSEDFELSDRVKREGHSILHDLRNVVRHADYADFEKFIHRQKEYKSSKEVLARVRPDLAGRFPEIFHKKINDGICKSWMRKRFVYNWLWKALFRSNVRMLIPEKTRFKLYDLVISSTIIFHSSVEEMI